ncbi:unnamed protein product [Mytilus edulis]|uniref:Transmembrane protein 234 n=1 Tax=Mytilus edulis TaxID=6550 RepID=A0A8S3QW56_MYTED|nr:unnamed protein product [Mytilus edulis]
MVKKNLMIMNRKSSLFIKAVKEKLIKVTTYFENIPEVDKWKVAHKSQTSLTHTLKISLDWTFPTLPLVVENDFSYIKHCHCNLQKYYDTSLMVCSCGHLVGWNKSSHKKRKSRKLYFLFSNWKYCMAFLLNQSGSVLFYLTLASVELSLAVPVTNSLTFIFTMLSGHFLGEKIQSLETFIGVAMVVLGVALCVSNKV